MKYLFLFLLIISTDPIEIARVNAIKREAEKAFLNKDFTTAIEKYKILKDSFLIDDDKINLNMGHAYTQINDTANARSSYSEASMSTDPKAKSIAYQQLGVLSKNPQTYKESLQYLKSALKADPSNSDARYDYEVVKKLLDQQQKQQQNQDDQNKKDQNKEEQEQNEEQNQDQQNQENKENQENKDQQNEQDQQDQQNQEEKENEESKEQKEQSEEQKSEEQKKKEQEMATKKKLEEMNISEEKAKMILEAMRNAEIQYLQQQKRKATEKPKSGKPDW